MNESLLQPDPLDPFNYSEWAEVIPLGAEAHMEAPGLDEQTQRENEPDDTAGDCSGIVDEYSLRRDSSNTHDALSPRGAAGE